MINYAESDLQKLITNMNPILNDGEYVFCLVSQESQIYFSIPREEILMEFKEKEGITLILKKCIADKQANDELKYEYVAAWLTLEIHSSLNAVGLTAMVSNALAEENISANVIAAYHHDHIFVDVKDGESACNVLNQLSKKVLM